MLLSVGFQSQECRRKIRAVAVDLGITSTLVLLDKLRLPIGRAGWRRRGESHVLVQDSEVLEGKLRK